MRATESGRAAGWYDDERDAAAQRYWDGASWTPHTVPRERPDDHVRDGEAGAATSVAAGAGATAATAAAVTAAVPGDSVARPATDATAIDAATQTVSRGVIALRGGAPGARRPSVPTATLRGVEPDGTRVPAFAPRSAPVFAPREVASTVPALPTESTIPVFSAAPSIVGAPVSTTAPAFVHDAASPSEHTTVPLPPKGSPAASAPHISVEQAYAPAGRSFVLIWLFALFLGSLGVDRFALGKTGTAVAKLLTAGGLGVWSLVDLVLVLTGVQRDRDGNPLAGSDALRRLAWIVSTAVIALGVCTGIAASLVAADLAASIGGAIVGGAVVGGAGSPDVVGGLP
ncbi:NINE protein [Agromyces sp. NPDC058110]|uniref:NINE protein n=1 Tax=Agromyces sp. NPDC058110 TaxID=3346345 RepID=UPI0036D860F0